MRQATEVQAVADIRARALAILKTCEQLEHSLPRTPEQMQDERSWPSLLSHFVLVSQQLKDLHAKTHSLQHFVPRPIDIAADRNGAPTLFVPLLLQTKLLPEQERDQKELLDVIRVEAEAEFASLKQNPNVIPEEITIDARLEASEQRVRDHKAVIEDADAMFDMARKGLMKQCAATVERFSGLPDVRSARHAIQLFRFLDSGKDRHKLVSSVTAPASLCHDQAIWNDDVDTSDVQIRVGAMDLS